MKQLPGISIHTAAASPAASNIVRILVLVGLAHLGCQSARSATILVPNGNFTNSANDGSVGGGLLAVSGSSLIGSGPWSGTYNAVAGLLIPPTLDIDDAAGGGTATISGVAGVNLLNIDNGGFFSETLTGVLYQANTQYTLSAEVDADRLLSALVLSSDGVGIGLTHGGSPLADTTNPLYLLGLSLLSGFNGDNYELQLSFTTGPVAPSGDIGIILFDRPNNLATINLLPSVTFRDVTLDATALSSSSSAVPEPSTTTLSGLGMIAMGLVIARYRAKAKRQQLA